MLYPYNYQTCFFFETQARSLGFPFRKRVNKEKRKVKKVNIKRLLRSWKRKIAKLFSLEFVEKRNKTLWKRKHHLAYNFWHFNFIVLLREENDIVKEQGSCQVLKKLKQEFRSALNLIPWYGCKGKIYNTF